MLRARSYLPNPIIKTIPIRASMLFYIQQNMHVGLEAAIAPRGLVEFDSDESALN